MRYFIGNDDSGHHYLVPVEKRAEWDAWVDQIWNEDSDCETPPYATPIDGGLLTFENPDIV